MASSIAPTNAPAVPALNIPNNSGVSIAVGPSPSNQILRSVSRLKRAKRFYHIPWWIALLFTIGCLFFAVASALSYGKVSDARYLEILHINLTGATCFLIGGLLGFVETFVKMAQVEGLTSKVRPQTLEDGSDSSERSSESESAKPEPIDCWIVSATLVGTIFFEVPGIVAYFYSSQWTWAEKLLYLNLHTIVGVLFFDVYAVLTFWKFGGKLFIFDFGNISFYPPFFYLLGGFPFVVYAILANLDVYYQVEAVTMSLIGSVLYFVGSVVMMVEIGLDEDDIC
jgi:hypothetical protein